jgi:thiamine biosynthesis lipoprotein
MQATSDPRRRRALAGLGWLVTGALAAPALAATAPADPSTVRAARALLGTRVAIVAHGVGHARLAAAVDAAFAEIARLEAVMSRYRPDSQVSALARAAGRDTVPVAPELIDVLARARAASALSEGAFDVTVGAYAGWDFSAASARVPGADELARERALVDWRDVVVDAGAGRAGLRRRGMRLDLGGVAKLPILEAARRVLLAHGVRDALLDGGGDVLTMGRLHGAPWRVGVRDPRAPDRLLGVVEVGDAVVASSGDYERGFVRDGRRYHHVLDARTGEPARGVRGVVAIAPTIGPLAALGASAMAAGPQAGRRLLAAAPGVDALLVDAGDVPWTSGGMARRLRG